MNSYQIISKNPRGFTDFEADEVGRDVILARAAQRHPEAGYESSPIEEIWLDFGGAIRSDEPRLHFQAAGIVFGIYEVQARIFCSFLKRAPGNERFPGCVTLNGQVRAYVFSFETRDAIVAALEELCARYQEQIAQAETSIADVYSSHPNLMSGNVCPCGSGKSMLNCCRPEP